MDADRDPTKLEILLPFQSVRYPGPPVGLEDPHRCISTATSVRIRRVGANPLGDLRNGFATGQLLWVTVEELIPLPDHSEFMMYGNDVMDLTILGLRSM